MTMKRLDHLVTERRLAASRTQAQRMIQAGDVLVNGRVSIKPADSYTDDVQITLRAALRFVSRGGEKLEAALNAFGRANLTGKICADIGASTGGFTDCLLQHDAQRVYAIDVGTDQLDRRLREDDRVVVMERTNIRDVHSLPEPVDLATIDASFISLKLILPGLLTWTWRRQADIIALIKPQFEAGREQAARGQGVIRDLSVHRHVLADLIAYAGEKGLQATGLIRSPITGPKGNVEYLAALSAGEGLAEPSVKRMIVNATGE